MYGGNSDYALFENGKKKIEDSTLVALTIITGRKIKGDFYDKHCKKRGFRELNGCGADRAFREVRNELTSVRRWDLP